MKNPFKWYRERKARKLEESRERVLALAKLIADHCLSSPDGLTKTIFFIASVLEHHYKGLGRSLFVDVVMVKE